MPFTEREAIVDVHHLGRMLRRAVSRCLQYVQRDFKEIVLPSSIPDASATDVRAARLHARDFVRVRPPLDAASTALVPSAHNPLDKQAFVEGSREYAESWSRTGQAASEPATAPQSTGGESREDMSAPLFMLCSASANDVSTNTQVLTDN